jgi:hypothetical protein
MIVIATFVMLNACYYSLINLICGTKILCFIIYIGFGIDLLGVVLDEVLIL